MEHFNVGRNLAVEHATGALAAELATAGINCVVLKGPLQARALRGAVHRGHLDIDLLVPPLSFAATEAVLARLGYVEAVQTTGDDEPDHAHSWERDKAIPVDLHWSLAGADPDRLWDVLSQSTTEARAAGMEVRVPDAAGTALVVALHAAQHGYEAEPVLDDLRAALGIVDEDDWRRATQLARAAGAEAAFAAGLGLLPEGRRMAELLKLSPAEVSVATALGLVTAAHTADGFQRFAEAGSLAARGRLVAEKLAPSPAFMRHKYALASRGRAGLVLAYLYRPLWLAWWAPRGYLAWRRAKRVAAASQRDAHG